MNLKYNTQGKKYECQSEDSGLPIIGKRIPCAWEGGETLPLVEHLL